MNKISIYRFVSLVLFAAAALASCSDWTEPESVQIKEGDIAADAPELYRQYLSDLRRYRQTDHKIVYTIFDNVRRAPSSNGEHLTAIPDSVDYVCLKNPADLPQWTVSEMETVSVEKGMQFVFNIDHNELEKAYTKYITENTPADPADAAPLPTIEEFTADYVDERLALVGKYGYDGISVLFYGMKTLHLTEAQKAAYLSKEAAFIAPIREWAASNPDKTFIFEGNPQNLTDKTLLQRAAFIVVRTESQRYAGRLGYEVRLRMEEGVPTDRFVVSVNAASLDPTDTKTGYFYDEQNRLVSAIRLASEWVTAPESGFTKYGLAVVDAQNDYYNPGRSYHNLRSAIAHMNPSPKR